MASTDRMTTRANVKRAYELGRLWHGARVALVVLPMTALSFVACGKPVVTALAGLTLLGLAVGFRWRGQTFGRAVTPGLFAGTASLVLPLALRTGGHCCIGGACWSTCMLGCIGGGILSGVAIGLASASEKERRWTFLISATLIAGFAGMLGCAIVGAAGVVGMAFSVVATSLPVVAIARLRSAS